MAYVAKSNEAKKLNLPGRISKELISSWNGSKNISLRLVTIEVQKEKQEVSCKMLDLKFYLKHHN